MADNIKAIEKLMDSYDSQRNRLNETRQLIDKWEPTGLLEGLDEENRVHSMACLLENQAKQLIDESSRTGTSAGSEEWSGVALPLVRRIFGELAAQDFVSVQPMNLPSGLIFYLDYKYGTAQAGHEVGGDVFGNTSGSNVDASGGLYGAGRFGYTVNDQEADSTFIAGHASSGSASSEILWKDVDFEPGLSSLTGSGGVALHRVTVPLSSLSGSDDEGIRAFEISGSAGSEVAQYYPAYTQITGSDLMFVVEPTTAATFGLAAGTVTVKYHKQPDDISRGDFEASSTEDFSGAASSTGGDAGIPEIDIQMRSIPIVAKTRKLKAVWTPELAQDLNAYHSVDAEAELTSMLSEYISMEIDLEILDMLRANANAKKEYWSARVGYEYADGAFSQSSGESNAYTKGTWFQTLGNKIQAVSNAIHQKTLRGGANFIVCSPETATILESIPGYAADTAGADSSNKFAMGVQKVGLLNNRWNVYKNPYMLENVILCGFRGANFLETGAVYAPYVPLIMTPLVYDPVNFTPRKGVMTRYAKKIVRPEFYGEIVVADVNYV